MKNVSRTRGARFEFFVFVHFNSCYVLDVDIGRCRRWRFRLCEGRIPAEYRDGMVYSLVYSYNLYSPRVFLPNILVHTHLTEYEWLGSWYYLLDRLQTEKLRPWSWMAHSQTLTLAVADSNTLCVQFVLHFLLLASECAIFYVCFFFSALYYLLLHEWFMQSVNQHRSFSISSIAFSSLLSLFQILIHQFSTVMILSTQVQR